MITGSSEPINFWIQYRRALNDPSDEARAHRRFLDLVRDIYIVTEGEQREVDPPTPIQVLLRGETIKIIVEVFIVEEPREPAIQSYGNLSPRGKRMLDVIHVAFGPRCLKTTPANHVTFTASGATGIDYPQPTDLVTGHERLAAPANLRAAFAEAGLSEEEIDALFARD